MAVYKDVVIGCWTVVALYWFVAAWSTKRTVEHQSWRSRVVLVLMIFAAIELLTVSRIMPDAALVVPQTPLVGMAGTAIGLVGLAFTLWARRTLGGNWSGWVTFKEGHELVQRGPYALVRHPIYTGVLTMFLGTAIVWARASAFAGLAVVFFALWVKSRQEEAMMLKHFPDQYPPYKARVKGIVPFVL
jgi:protein-S-isoprenylcysteine O-methyltransferase Ste14